MCITLCENPIENRASERECVQFACDPIYNRLMKLICTICTMYVCVISRFHRKQQKKNQNHSVTRKKNKKQQSIEIKAMPVY